MNTTDELLKELISLVREIKDDLQIQHSERVNIETSIVGHVDQFSLIGYKLKGELI